MKQNTTILIVLCLLFTNFSFSQDDSNSIFLKDLDFVYSSLKNSTSYKTQKSTHNDVETKYIELRTSVTNQALTPIAQYIKLYELVDQVNDLHNEISGNIESFTYDDLVNPEIFEKLKKNRDYNIFPRSKLDLDSLETELSKRKFDDQEGIYHYQKYFKIAIVKQGNRLEGIVLNSKIPSWERGETILYLLPKGNNSFRIITGQFIDKQLISTTDYFSNGAFLAMSWKKDTAVEAFSIASFPKEKFVFKNLESKINYIKIGSFYSSNDGIKEGTEFYNSIPKLQKGDNLIVDLRNNSGGGDKVSDMFYKLLKKHKGQIFILMNFATTSNAEQFIIKLKEKHDVTLLGQRTKGIATYGHNYSDDQAVPSGNFRIYFSDMKDNWRRYLPYELIGVNPNLDLLSDRDWIVQTIDIISKRDR